MLTYSTEIKTVLHKTRKAQAIAKAATARQRAAAVEYLHRLQSRYLGLTTGRVDRLSDEPETTLLHRAHRAARAELATLDRACFVQGWREAYHG